MPPASRHQLPRERRAIHDSDSAVASPRSGDLPAGSLRQRRETDEIERFLTRRGHRVQLVNTYYFSRAGEASKMPSLRPGRLMLYLTEVLAAINRRWQWGHSHLSYYFTLADFRLRGRILDRSLELDDADFDDL